jgi:hypothetical protein
VEYHRRRARAGLGMQINGATPVLSSEVWAGGLTLVNIDDRIIHVPDRLERLHERVRAVAAAVLSRFFSARFDYRVDGGDRVANILARQRVVSI